MNLEQFKIHIELTSDCPHRCIFCYRACGRTQEEIMENQTIDRLFDSLDKNNNLNKSLSFVITGGEPFNNIDGLEYFVKKAEERNFLYSINTCLDVDKELLKRFFSKHKCGILIGAPSTDYNAYKKSTGNGNFKNVRDNIIFLKQYDVNIAANIVVTNLNYDYVIESVQKFIMLGVNSFFVTKANSVIYNNGKSFENTITTEQMISLYREILDYEKHFNNIRFLGSCSCDTFCLFPDEPIFNRFAKQCGAGNSLMALSPKGTLRQCTHFPENMNVGSIFETEIIDLILKNIKWRQSLEIDQCKDCKIYKTFCFGGCLANSINPDGTVMLKECKEKDMTQFLKTNNRQYS